MLKMKSVSMLAAALFALPSFAASVELKDPRGDDKGPGTYTYPTGAPYKAGSFDLINMKVAEKGQDIVFTIEIATQFTDPWNSKAWPTPGNGFSMQMFQVYIDTDGKKGSGEKDALSGMNATFAEDSRWEKVVVIGAHSNKRIKSEVDQKAKAVADKVVLPKEVKVRGKTVTAVVSKKDLDIDVTKVGYQVLAASAEGFPADKDILSRRVNEYEGEHRFGGGDDGMFDPHFLDVFAGNAKGEADEAKAQQDMLKYDAAKKKRAVLTMVRP